MTIETGDTDHSVSLRVERRWAMLSFCIVTAFTVLAAAAGLHEAIMPQRRVETIDPETLHVQGEFVEANLGSALEPDGSVIVRAIGQQYSFTPQCILVPTGTPVTFRMTSADVVHGFLIQATNLNEMLVPGYVTSFTARFDKPGEHAMPCHEFCGVGHEGMWAKFKIIDRREFLAKSQAGRRISCVEQ